MRDAGSMNPLFMIDEIDKMGATSAATRPARCSRCSTPSRTATFRDHYLDVPFDLSNVMFIATANTLDTIPGPLRDRMEVIEIAGYTEEEKLQIAKRYLVPRQIERNGLKRKQISIHDRALRAVIRDYTREAGVRNLEREIGRRCRKSRAGGEGTLETKRHFATRSGLPGAPGPRRFSPRRPGARAAPGVATGLALDAGRRRRSSSWRRPRCRGRASR
jgi:ATP-dependent Lon protease